MEKPLKRLGTQCLPSKQTKDLIKKVDKVTDSANPPTQKELARRLKVSSSTIRRVLKDNLRSELKKKAKTHALFNKQPKQRLDRGPHFLKLIDRTKWKYIISLDQAWLSLNNVKKIRDVYYQKEGKKTPKRWIRKWRMKHEKK